MQCAGAEHTLPVWLSAGSKPVWNHTETASNVPYCRVL